MTGWTEEDVPPVTEGTLAVVTGANTGLGLDTTRVLAQRGATVVMACRNQDKAAAARQGLIDRGVDPGRLRTASLDLADQGSIADFADGLPDGRIDLLINNAGLMAVPRSVTADSFETQFGVNHLGHMALTLRLLPRLNATPGARVVTLTSMGHRPGRIRLDDPNFRRGRYNRWTAYFQSKLANMLFTAELARRNEGRGALSLAAHPGYAATELGKDTGIQARLLSVADRLAAQPSAAGAWPTLRAATDPAAVNGALYGPRRLVSGAAVHETPSRTARRTDLAVRLWDLSLDLLSPAKVTDPLA
ncbi:SDR family NAD(P)-dependent oxidoreductase [Streptomyces sp. Tu 2975]|uniref:oxidoreductase n=1 Tax=Streptomyces sp. Tu 2975 TaxID=2676871 RepID=UPI0013571B64|nr:oxidoreductase [Streptomyces sp. Tu 2975]QIP83762.1 SDR family NAD(P)-dependent oxidoreductase [Streptomyces sp. Tu 2975]